MSKFEKTIGIPSPADAKRIDPPAKPHKKAGRKRKDYPPHWEVRLWWGVYSLTAHKLRPVVPYHWEGDEPPNRKNLVDYLAWSAQRYPHTASLPVRFFGCQPEECGREIIQT